MSDFFLRLFDTTGFPQRWYCGTGWTPELGWTHIVSDIGVWSAYFTIPLILVFFAQRRPDLPFRGMFLLFGCFILFCGLTHLMDAAIFWWPAYRLSALIRLSTAIVSWATVIALIPIVPKVLSLRSPMELEREIAERRRAETALLKLQHELENRVNTRTAELTEVNEKLREREEQLQKALGDLRLADQRKDEFLAILAHELRNPLAAVGSGLQLVQLAPSNGEVVREATQTMDRQFRHVIRLVDDLLDVSRIMRNKIELRPEAIELSAVVERALEVSQPVIDEQGHTIEVRLPSEPLQLVADPVRLTQVISNLLTNAAKYTDPGGSISLEAHPEAEQLVLTVRDTGIGISAELLPKVFDIFMQADRGLARSRGGLGIGLQLVKKLVHLHGGTVQAVSEGPGKGSAFTIRLPLGGADELRAPEKAAATLPVNPRTILMVDDNRDMVDTLASVLRVQGHQVSVAYDGAAALRAIDSKTPEVVVLDLGMPEMDGLEVARRIRSRLTAAEVMLIALTGWGGKADRERTLAAGFDHHLVKPLRLEEFEQLLGAAPQRAQ